MLVLQSFKLATEFLKKGGWFVTKVFRSKDYHAIMWVFQQFFKKVESTKPQASRNESAEIFVVCQSYKAPDKIDPKFFDIKFVFSEVESAADGNKAVDLFKPPKRNRGGYPDGDMTLYHVLAASEFVRSENFIELLAKSNRIELDDERIASHAATSAEIAESVKDLKVLGKTDLK
jgi:AdoMet-dependent rRNA methyltransferase SPB1